MSHRRLLVFFLAALPILAQEGFDPSRGKRARGSGWYNGRAVTFDIVDGLAVVQGDIILGTVEELMTPPAVESGNARASVAIAAESARWPNKTVVYDIDSGLPNQARVTDAIAHWEARTSIRFKRRTNETGFVLLRRISSGCNSDLGYRGRQQLVNLEDGCSLGNTIHELGHTIGFHHTQVRADRNNHIRVLYENLDKDYVHDFDQLLTTTMDLGPYDYGSIMHYPLNSFRRSYRNTLESIPLGIVVGQRTSLSTGDIQATERLYGGTVNDFVVTTNPVGLPVIVDGERHTSPKSFSWTPGETHTISAPLQQNGTDANHQLRFSKWSDGGDADHTITVAGNKTLYIANYANYYRLQAGWRPASAGSVHVTPATSDLFYPEGAVVHLTATPAGDQRFLDWVGGTGGATYLTANGQGNASNPVELTLRASNAFYIAEFVAPSVPITSFVSTVPGVTISVDNSAGLTPRNFAFAPGSAHNIAIGDSQFGISTSEKFVYQSWSTGAARTQTITADTKDTAIKLDVKHQFEVFTNLDGLYNTRFSAPSLKNIQLSPASSDNFYDAGSTIELTAEGPEGVPFSNWLDDLSGTTSRQTMTVDEQSIVTANFLSEPYFNASSLVNQASLQPSPAIPDANMILYRTNIGPDKAQFAEPNSDGLYPTTFSGVSVSFDGKPAQIVGVFKNGIYVIPPEMGGKQAINVTARGTISYTSVMPALDATPGIYTTNDFNGFGQALAANEDGSANSKDNPVDRGGVILVLATGLGKLNDDGTFAQPFLAEVGGYRARVLGAVAGEFAGDWAVAIELDPDTPTGPAVPLALFVGGARSQLKVTIAVK